MGRISLQTSLSLALHRYARVATTLEPCPYYPLQLVCAPSDDEAHPIKVNYEKLLFMSCTCLAAVMVICVGDSVSADRRVIRSFRTHKLAAQFLRASNIQFPAFLKARYDNIVGSACASSWVSLGFTVALSAALTKMVQVRAIPFPTIALPSPYGVSMYVTKCEVSLMEMATAFLLGIAFALPIVRSSVSCCPADLTGLAARRRRDRPQETNLGLSEIERCLSFCAYRILSCILYVYFLLSLYYGFPALPCLLSLQLCAQQQPRQAQISFGMITRLSPHLVFRLSSGFRVRTESRNPRCSVFALVCLAKPYPVEVDLSTSTASFGNAVAAQSRI